jgi:transmembrane sensor
MTPDLSRRQPPDDPDDAAAYWRMRLQSGAISGEEVRALTLWRAASAENDRAFRRLDAALAGLDAHAEKLLAEEFERQLEDAAADESRPLRAPALRIAASVAAAAMLSAGAYLAFRAIVAPAAPDLVAYETAIGESATVTLADGSEAQLDTASRIEVRYTKGRRSVEILAGQAFFEVEKEPARPFVVQAANAAITVTGTSFGVLTEGARTSVHVVTGAVDVMPRFGPGATLLAGDMIEINAEGKASDVIRFDPSVILAWRGGKARFRGEPLGQVVTALNRYFATPIVLENDALSGLPVTGEFDVRDRETAVRALALIFGLEARDEPARTVLAPPETE